MTTYTDSQLADAVEEAAQDADEFVADDVECAAFVDKLRAAATRLRLQPMREEVQRMMSELSTPLPVSFVDGLRSTAKFLEDCVDDLDKAEIGVAIKKLREAADELARLRSQPTSEEVQTILCSMPLEFAGHPWSRRACDLIERLTSLRSPLTREVRRFACFTMEDGVYESASGEHVAYADYESLARSEAEARALITAHQIRPRGKSDSPAIAAAIAERDAARAESAAHKADAERYRWLRVHSTGPVEPWSTHGSPESLDAAIDAARSAAKESP